MSRACRFRRVARPGGVRRDGRVGPSGGRSEAGGRRRHSTTPRTRWPMPVVIARAHAPPSSTRVTARPAGAPASRDPAGSGASWTPCSGSCPRRAALRTSRRPQHQRTVPSTKLRGHAVVRSGRVCWVRTPLLARRPRRTGRKLTGSFGPMMTPRPQGDPERGKGGLNPDSTGPGLDVGDHRLGEVALAGMRRSPCNAKHSLDGYQLFERLNLGLSPFQLVFELPDPVEVAPGCRRRSGCPSSTPATGRYLHDAEPHRRRYHPRSLPDTRSRSGASPLQQTLVVPGHQHESILLPSRLRPWPRKSPLPDASMCPWTTPPGCVASSSAANASRERLSPLRSLAGQPTWRDSGARRWRRPRTR